MTEYQQLVEWLGDRETPAFGLADMEDRDGVLVVRLGGDPDCIRIIGADKERDAWKVIDYYADGRIDGYLVPQRG